MFSNLKHTICYLLIIGFLAGCDSIQGKNNEDEEQKSAAESSEAPASDPQNPVTNTLWCRMEDWTTFQVVLRVRATNENIFTEYLRLGPQEAMSKYKFQKVIPWELRKGENIWEDNPEFGRYVVSTIATPAIREPLLVGFEEQKRIAEKVLPTLTLISPPNPVFTPELGLSLKTRDVYSGDVVDRNMYPCSAYSLSFLEDAPERPMMELILKISKSMETFTEKGLNRVATAMDFQEPVREISMSPEALNGSHWCAWREVSEDRLKLYTVSFSGDRFVENAYTENFLLAPDEAGLIEFLKQNSLRSEIYQYNFDGGRILGKNQSQENRKFLPEDLFTFVQDAAGTKAMVRLSVKQPEHSRPYFDDIYFECSHPKPLEFSAGFKERLPLILELQKGMF